MKKINYLLSLFTAHLMIAAKAKNIDINNYESVRRYLRINN
ncbi:hypothetical protein [Mucilaginibacter endophyticus]|nr:hypothetical protein [Mucilaginibacter endophyticus]